MRPHDAPQGLGYPGPRLVQEGEDDDDSGDSIYSNIARLRRALSEASPWQLLCLVLDSLKPEILQRGPRRRHNTANSGRTSSPRPHNRPDTAWLDGLRGWAAFSVCLAHMSVYTHPRIEQCYGSLIAPSPDSGHRSLRNATPAAVPVLRLFWSGGHFAVMIFFVISGYVLTKRPITLLLSPPPGASSSSTVFVDALHSAMFRRPLRLFLPVACSTLFFATSWHVLGAVPAWPELKASLGAELWSWARELLKFCYFFRGRVLYTYYNIHTWTIPVELRGSYAVLVWLFLWGRSPAAADAASSKSSSPRPRPRVLATTAMTLYLAVCAAGGWYAAFFAGMLTAEVDAIGSATAAAAATVDGKPPIGDSGRYNNHRNHDHNLRLPWDGLLDFIRQRPRFRRTLLHAMLAAGLYLGSEPSSDIIKAEDLLGKCRGWKTLSRLIPAPYLAGDEPESVHRWFWLFWAAWLLFVSIKELGWARSLFETRFSQYLGKHSFALYLVHGPMIGLVSERLFYLTGVKRGPLSDDEVAKFGHLMNRWRDASWWPFPRHGTPSAVDVLQPYYYGLEPEFLVCVVLSMPVFLYAAELGTKMFDEPSVKMSQWAYRKLKLTGR